MTKKGEESNELTEKPVKKKAVKKAAKKKAVKKSVDEKLVDAIVEGMQEKKAEGVTIINLRNIESRVCDYYVLCQANTGIQVDAIAGSIEEIVKKKTKEIPYRTEGYQNAEWVLIDYISVVAHVFQADMREHYNLESLWADAEIKELD